MLGIYPLTLLIFSASFVILCFDCNFLWLTLAVYLFVFIWKWIILGKSYKKLRANKFIAWLPVLDVVYSIVTPIFYYTSDKSDTKKW
jgi:energy-coupling factor transporter transmembrane protein EcfT